MAFIERVINTVKSSESPHDATSIQSPFLPLSVTNILFTASFKKAHKSLLDIWFEAPHPNWLVSSAICPMNGLIMW
jgi:hypothetical protein